MTTDNQQVVTLRNRKKLPYSFPDGLVVNGKKLSINDDGTVTTGVDTSATEQNTPATIPAGALTVDILVSQAVDNRLKIGPDGKLYVKDNFDPDPLAYYILAKN